MTNRNINCYVTESSALIYVDSCKSTFSFNTCKLCKRFKPFINDQKEEDRRIEWFIDYIFRISFDYRRQTTKSKKSIHIISSGSYDVNLNYYSRILIRKNFTKSRFIQIYFDVETKVDVIKKRLLFLANCKVNDKYPYEDDDRKKLSDEDKEVKDLYSSKEEEDKEDYEEEDEEDYYYDDEEDYYYDDDSETFINNYSKTFLDYLSLIYENKELEYENKELEEVEVLPYDAFKFLKGENIQNKINEKKFAKKKADFLSRMFIPIAYNKITKNPTLKCTVTNDKKGLNLSICERIRNFISLIIQSSYYTEDPSNIYSIQKKKYLKYKSINSNFNYFHNLEQKCFCSDKTYGLEKSFLKNEKIFDHLYSVSFE